MTRVPSYNQPIIPFATRLSEMCQSSRISTSSLSVDKKCISSGPHKSQHAVPAHKYCTFYVHRVSKWYILLMDIHPPTHSNTKQGFKERFSIAIQIIRLETVFSTPRAIKSLYLLQIVPVGVTPLLLEPRRIILLLLYMLARNNNDTDEPYTAPFHGFCNSMSTLHYPCGTGETFNAPLSDSSTTNPPSYRMCS